MPAWTETIALDGMPDSPVLEAISELLPALHRLHAPNRRTLVKIRQRTLAGEEGRYVFPILRTNTPAEIWIKRRSGHPRMTFLHEIGHFLDNQCLHPLMQSFFTDFDEPELVPLARAWKHSRCVRHLENILARRSRMRARGDAAYLRNVLSFHELWARSHAQWAAIRLGEPSLLSELGREIGQRGLLAGIPYTLHWERDDFDDIMDAVDDLLQRKGLL